MINLISDAYSVGQRILISWSNDWAIKRRTPPGAGVDGALGQTFILRISSQEILGTHTILEFIGFVEFVGFIEFVGFVELTG